MKFETTAFVVIPKEKVVASRELLSLLMEFLDEDYGPSDRAENPGRRPLRQRQAIKIAMIRNRISGAALARKLGVSRQAVYMTISGALYSEKIGQALIAAGVPARLLPEYGEEDAA